jgi:hypothetical protein
LLDPVVGRPYEPGHVFGWIVDIGVNAKNGYGGYTGEQAYDAFFANGQLRGIFVHGKHKDIFGYPTWETVALMPAR